MGHRYTVKSAARAVREPGRIVGEMRRLGIKANRWLNDSTTNESHDLMGADWDILIILDGCRFDLFEEESTLYGETQRVVSAGSESREFMQSHFTGRNHYDTVYVSANPYTNELAADAFHDVRNVYDTHWDDDLETVHPESVSKVACNAAEMYPNKRIIAHFMQPHYPFIGETGQSFEAGGMTGGGDVWTLLQNRRCPVDEKTVWEAYAENYRLTEPSVHRIQNHVKGKVVVTADHGNLVGERLSPIPVKCYGHPGGIRHPNLVTVPWHEMPVNTHRETQSDPPKERSKVDEEGVEEQLEALGYR